MSIKPRKAPSKNFSCAVCKQPTGSNLSVYDDKYCDTCWDKVGRPRLDAERAKHAAQAAANTENEAVARRNKELEVPVGRHELVRHKETVTVKNGKETMSVDYLTQITVVNADEVQVKPIPWLWFNRIPMGHISYFVGKPGNSKSLSTTDLAARISSGADFPDCENPHGPKKVLFYAGEDPLKEVVIPRLIAAGANLKNIKLLDNQSFKVIDKEGNRIDRREIDLSQDVPVINHLIHDHPDVTLIILDPITGVFGNRNTNKDEEMRPIFNQLKEMLERRATTLVGVAHTNKRSDASAIHQIQGCSSMAAAPRAAWLFTRDSESDDEHAHMMTCIKGNLSSNHDGLKLLTVAVDIPGAGEHPMVKWGEATKLQADDANQALKEKREQKNDKRGVIKNMILSEIASEPKRSKDVYKVLREAGFSDTTSERAADDLTRDFQIMRKQKPGQKGWWMALPQHADQFDPLPTTEGRQMQDVEAL